MCRWGPACADGDQCVQMGAEMFPCLWVGYLKDYTVGFCDGTKGWDFENIGICYLAKLVVACFQQRTGNQEDNKEPQTC